VDNMTHSIDSTALHQDLGFKDLLKYESTTKMNEFLSYSKRLHYSPGELIVVGGDESGSLYYVEKGTIEVSYKIGDTRIVVALIGPSSFFGEIGFFDGVTRVRDIQVTEEAEISFFDTASIDTMRLRNPLLYGDFVTIMAQSICTKFRNLLEEKEPSTAYGASVSTKRGSFEEAKPIPPSLMQTESWRHVNGLVESFKTSFFNFSYQLQQENSQDYSPELASQCHTVLNEFNDSLQATSKLLKKSEVTSLLWGYAFKEIFPYFMRSRFAERAYYKPNGYAGDFQMMEMIYKNKPDGDGKLGRLVDEWCLETAAARAVRGRRKFLKEWLHRLSNDKLQKGQPVKIMNLACGSNRELFDYIAGSNRPDLVTALCIDADPRALEYTNRYVNIFPHTATIKLMADNMVRWALGRVRHSIGFQDIIYSAGLTDYLDDRICTALFSRCYEHLEENGTFIIGNFGYENRNKVFLDEILQWRLIHRSKDDLLRLFSNTPFGPHVEIASEENGVNLFAIARKG
jgi:extracellular factor (EF) 3-hydroxypalmitic acid methyl ester biosynthesis protein